MIGAELIRYNKEQLYCCGDVETTGLNISYSLPWQLSYLTFTLDKDIQQRTQYIWWKDLKVGKQAALITRFDYNHYKENAEDPIRVLEEFEDTLYSKDYNIVSQNWLGYDSMIINVWRKQLGLKPRYDYMLGRVYDTIALSKAIKLGLKPDISSDKAFLAWQFRMLGIVKKGLKTSLGVMGKELNVTFAETGLHDAKNDVLLNAGIFRKQVWMLEI